MLGTAQAYQIQAIAGINSSLDAPYTILGYYDCNNSCYAGATVNDQLKNISQIEHTRHRNVWNFMANILASLIAYPLQPKKLLIKL